MTENLDVNTKQLLSQYLAEVRSLPNESAKTHRFVAMVGQAFPRVVWMCRSPNNPMAWNGMIASLLMEEFNTAAR